MPLLSICIPTYNRVGYLRECLDSIITQDEFNIQEIEIVISDNASTDDTTILVQEYTGKYPNIIYHRNTENIGAIRNIMNLPNFANGEYIWYLSDDDMLSPIAFSESLPILRQMKIDFFLCRFLGFWNGERISFEKLRKTWETHEFIGVSQFFSYLKNIKYDITPYIMLLSIFCFRKTLFINSVSELLDQKGSMYISTLQRDNFIHATIIYSVLWENHKILLMERDLILNRGDNISWNFNFVVCQDLYRLIWMLKMKYHVWWKLAIQLKKIYYYAVATYIIIVYIKKILPTSIYNFCVYVWRVILGRS